MLQLHTFPWWKAPYTVVLKALEKVKEDTHAKDSARFLLQMGVREPLVVAAALLHHAPHMEGFPEEIWEIVKGKRKEHFLIRLACSWARPPHQRIKALRQLKPPKEYLPLYLSTVIRAKEELGRFKT